MLAKLLGTVGLKGGLGALLKKFGGRLGHLLLALAMGEGYRQCFVGCCWICCWCCYWSGINSNTNSWRFIGGILGESLLKKCLVLLKIYLD